MSLLRLFSRFHITMSINHFEEPYFLDSSPLPTAFPSSDLGIQTKCPTFISYLINISASEITGPLRVGGLVNHEMASRFPGSDHCLLEVWGFLCGSRLLVFQLPSHVPLFAAPWTAVR